MQHAEHGRGCLAAGGRTRHVPCTTHAACTLHGFVDVWLPQLARWPLLRPAWHYQGALCCQPCHRAWLSGAQAPRARGEQEEMPPADPAWHYFWQERSTLRRSSAAPLLHRTGARCNTSPSQHPAHRGTGPAASGSAFASALSKSIPVFPVRAATPSPYATHTAHVLTHLCPNQSPPRSRPAGLVLARHGLVIPGLWPCG